MATRLQYVFLKHRFLHPSQRRLGAALIGLGLSLPLAAQAQQSEQEPVEVISPELDRREIKTAKIDKENYEVGVYTGLLSMQDFDANLVVGLRAAYHITEDFFFEGTYGQSKGDLTSFEQLSGGSPLFSDTDREYRYYNLSVGWNIFPGEVFIGRNRAFNSSFYLVAGVGSTDFVGNTWFTYSFGAGYRLLLTDWLAWHIDARDHIFTRDSFGSNEVTNNLEFHTGFTVFF